MKKAFLIRPSSSFYLWTSISKGSDQHRSFATRASISGSLARSGSNGHVPAGKNLTRAARWENAVLSWERPAHPRRQMPLYRRKWSQVKNTPLTAVASRRKWSKAPRRGTASRQLCEKKLDGAGQPLLRAEVCQIIESITQQEEYHRCVSHLCKAAGISRNTFYEYRRNETACGMWICDLKL